MKSELASQHMPLVHFVAKKFLGRARFHRIEYDDLFGAGCLGLVKAVNNFDPERGIQFSTYSVHIVSGEIKRLFRDYKPLGVGRSVHELATKIYRADMEGASPSEIAECFGCSIRLAARTLQYLECRMVSMNAPLPSTDGNVTWEDALPIDEDYTVDTVSDFLATLSYRDQAVLKYRMQGLTQTEIGKRIGVGQVSIGRVLGRISEKYRIYDTAAV